MVEYRKADEKDKEEAAKVLLENYNIKNLEEAKKVFLEELSRYHYLVSMENGKIVGIACWRPHGLPKHQLAEIGRVAVLPEKKGTGAATDVFSRVVQEADKFYKSHKTKLRKVYVYVHSSNKKAQDFYAKSGLIKEAVLKDHYYKGEDEFVYSMFLD
jgi:ribosomal protein S18 acetylase RimI-like enzyme